MAENRNRKSKIVLLFLIFSFSLLILIARFLYIDITKSTNFPNLRTSEIDTALRGSIISLDHFTLSSSKKLYKAEINTYNIDPNKKELFVKLFSIYSGMNPKRIMSKLNSHKGRVVLSYRIDSKRAFYLKELAKKLYNLKVFREYEDKRTKIIYRSGLDILESGEYRDYKYKDIFTPYIGYLQKRNDNKGFTRGFGVKGVEKYYDENLKPLQNGFIYGQRDVVNNIIFNRKSKVIQRIDGGTLYLNVNLKLQKSIEHILDKLKNDLGAKEIVAAVMESNSGKILSLATTKRYNPNRIKKSDYSKLNITASEYAYEPGSVMKPITLSILLKNSKVNPYEIIDVHGGRYKIKNKIIKDDHRFEKLSAEDIIVHSSNVGISILAQRLDAIDFFQGLKDFGFSKQSGVDLFYDKKGSIPSVLKMQNEIYKATVAYGYGLRVTFMQLLKAYNVFNNNGIMLKPLIASYILFNNKSYPIVNDEQKRVLSQKTASQIKDILIKTVNEGTGKRAKTEGLQIGGKTGTAHIASFGVYKESYNSSFFGFANDKERKYTIGVFVKEPKIENYTYFASKSAVVVFKSIVDEMLEQKLLISEPRPKSR